ncbi:thioester domain-containing protein [Streptomonospora litoralis]|uniref:Thioester domain-containing protein n=1 Tax=Streptomonospora litoralis TaxID=2498135 RepID=A0A4V0ZJC1_9ACTN|nr:thioester domain-containing protein [Streptomonospora litoralis]QBI52962.1 hypothetical protein EKD16_05795 [Streptomonospora litoralis]
MSGFARRCLAAAAALAIAAGVPLPASAESITRVAPDPAPGATVRLADGSAAETSLYRLMAGEDVAVDAYCADISTSVNPRAAYTEAEWDGSGVPRSAPAASAAVSWITGHSYPEVGLKTLRTLSGATALDREQAIAATQAAVWHHTNGVNLARGTGRQAGNAASTLDLYDYLLAGAEENGGAEPGATLALAPARVEGADPAAAIGPLTVETTSSGPVAVWVRGAPNGRITDGEGGAVELVRDGEEFFLRLPPETPAGVATVYARVTDAEVRPGRLYAGKDGVRTQPLVAADHVVTSATAVAKVDWVPEAPAAEADPRPEPPESARPPAQPDERDQAPSAAPSARPTAEASSPSPEEVVVAEDRRPDEHLAQTGTWLGTLLILGLALVAVGAAVLYLARRRRSL